MYVYVSMTRMHNTCMCIHTHIHVGLDTRMCGNATNYKHALHIHVSDVTGPPWPGQGCGS